METLAVGLGQGVQGVLLAGVERLGILQVALNQQRPLEQPGPAFEDFAHIPAPGPFAVDAHDDVEVVAHHGIGGDIDGEDAGQLLDAVGDPAPAVGVVLAGLVVLAAQEGAADTAVDAVVPGGVVQGYEGGAGLGHGWSLRGMGKGVK